MCIFSKLFLMVVLNLRCVTFHFPILSSDTLTCEVHRILLWFLSWEDQFLNTSHWLCRIRGCFWKLWCKWLLQVIFKDSSKSRNKAYLLTICCTIVLFCCFFFSWLLSLAFYLRIAAMAITKYYKHLNV